MTQILTPYLEELTAKRKRLTATKEGKPLATPLHLWATNPSRVLILGGIQQTGLLGRITDRTAVAVSELTSRLAQQAAPEGTSLVNWTIEWGLRSNPMRARKRIKFISPKELRLTMGFLTTTAWHKLMQNTGVTMIDLRQLEPTMETNDPTTAGRVL